MELVVLVKFAFKRRLSNSIHNINKIRSLALRDGKQGKCHEI